MPTAVRCSLPVRAPRRTDLLPDKREGALVIYKDKHDQKLVQWMPMVYGIIKKIRQSGEINSIGARLVYQKEIDDNRFRFIIEDGQEKLYHDPMLWGVRGDKVLVYAYARFKSGHVEYAPMHKLDVLKRKNASKSTTGPWQSWEDEMWLKTAIRSLAKRLPLSAEIMSTVERDEPSEFDRMKKAAQDITNASHQLAAPVEDEPQPEPESESEQTLGRRTGCRRDRPDHPHVRGIRQRRRHAA